LILNRPPAPLPTQLRQAYLDAGSPPTVPEMVRRSQALLQPLEARGPDGALRVLCTGPSQRAVDLALDFLRDRCEMKAPPGAPPEVPGEPQVTESVACPEHLRGKIIGRGGETIRALQRQYQCNMQLDRAVTPTMVRIRGAASRVALAKSALLALLTVEADTRPGLGTDPSAPARDHARRASTVLVHLAKDACGKLIGRQGQTIKALQERARGVRLALEHNADPAYCEITGTGKQTGGNDLRTCLLEVARGEHLTRVLEAGLEGYAAWARATGGFGCGAPYPPPDPSREAAAGKPAAPGLAAPPPPWGGAALVAPPVAYPGYPPVAPAGYPGAYPPAQTGGYPPAPSGYPLAQGGGYPAPNQQTGYPAAPAYPAYPAPAPPAAPPAAGWEEHKDDQGRPYWWNRQTGASSWTKPQ